MRCVQISFLISAKMYAGLVVGMSEGERGCGREGGVSVWACDCGVRWYAGRTHLDDQGNIESVLQPLGEHEWDEVAHVQGV